MEKKQENNTPVFSTLSRVDVKGRTEKIGQLTYLSWAWAWGFVKENYPDATYTIYENEHGWPYHTDGRTAWVKTGLAINGLEHIEYLPIMDNRHLSIPVESITSRNVNDSIQRSLTKAAARHGLGLNVYAGEDLLMFRDPVPVAEPPVSDGSKAKAGKDAPAAAKPAKSGEKRLVTLAALNEGKCEDIVSWLREKKGDEAGWQERTAKMLKGYQWDSLNTYNEIIRKANS